MSDKPFLQLRPGDCVTIPFGVFANQNAEVTEADTASHSVTLKILIFGRPVFQQYTFKEWTESSESAVRYRVAKQLKPWLERHKRPAWFPTLVETDGPLTASKYGGVPWLAEGEAWPACGACKRPLALFLQLNLADLPEEVAGRFGTGLLQFFYCANERNKVSPCYGDTFQHFSPCHCLRIVQPQREASTLPVPATGHVSAAKVITGWERFDDYPGSMEHEELGLITHQQEYAAVAHFEVPELGIVTEDFNSHHEEEIFLPARTCRRDDKLSGWPCWVQDPRYPNCPRCQRRMELVYQHTGDHVSFMFGDCGIGHITQCPEHKDVLAFGWDGS